MTRQPRPFAFGPLQPDLQQISNAQGLFKADNVLPVKNGYAPMPSWVDLGEAALAKRPRGGISGFDNAGNAFNFVGTEDTLYRIGSTGTVDVSKVGGYGLSSRERWEFAKFGNVIIATTFDSFLQVFDLGSSSKFADVPAFAPGLSVPRGRHVGVVRLMFD